MRRFSKIAAVALVGALALTGCGSGSGSEQRRQAAQAAEDVCKAADGDGPKVGVAYDVGGRGDQSFNDSAYEGMEKAVDELGATCTEAKAAPDENDTIRAERLRTLAEGASTRSSRSGSSTRRPLPRWPRSTPTPTSRSSTATAPR